MDSLSEPPIMPNATRIPRAIRLPAVCVLSLGLSVLVHSFTSSITGPELAIASRDATETWRISALLAWKVVQLAAAWVAGYDYQDLASLTLLTNMPYYYLLYTFWALELVPVLASLSVDIVTVAVPFALLRPVHAHHSATGNKTPNQAIALDWQVSLLTAGLAACLYSTIWYFTYLFSDLSVFLITHFESLPTLERLHASTIPALLQLFAGNGVAAMIFMFRPAMAASGPPKTVTRRRSGSKKFRAETATLAETLAYNIWGEAGPSPRGEVLAKRAGMLMLMTMANTFTRVFGTVDGTDVVGSLGYAALWTCAQGMVAVGYSILGQE